MIGWCALCLLLAAAPAHCAHQQPARRTLVNDAGASEQHSSWPASDPAISAAATAAAALNEQRHPQLLQQQQPPQCRNGTRRCGSKCVRLNDPAACGPACARCPKPTANGVATCSRKGVCGVSCAKGYKRAANNAACRLCGANTFKAVAGPGPCTPCPAGTFTRQPSSDGQQPPAAAHDEATDCVAPPVSCPPGQQADTASATGCSVCAADTFKDVTGPGPCTPCPAGTFTAGDSPTDHDEQHDCSQTLACGPGMQPDQDTCVVCPANTTKAGTNANKCQLCPDGSRTFGNTTSDHDEPGDCYAAGLRGSARNTGSPAEDLLNFEEEFERALNNTGGRNNRPGSKSCSTGWGFTEALAAMKAAPAAFVMNNSCLRPGVDPAQLPDAQLRAFCTDKVSVACQAPRLNCRDSKALSDGVAQIQRYMRLYGSVVTRIDVSDSFMSFFKDNPTGVFNGTADTSLSTEGKSEQHAVQLIGYNNEEKFWLAKNSWGSNWGDQGLFRIAYGVADVGHPEDTFALVDCFTTSKDPETVAAWSDRWPVVVDELPGCVLYNATARDTISGIVDHFQVDILTFINDNTQRRVIPTLMLGEQPRPEPQLQPNTSWAGTVFRVCDIPSTIYDRVVADPCTTNPNYCNGRQTSCAASGCVCPERYSGRFCEIDNKTQSKFSLPGGQDYVLHLEPRLSWTVAQQRCERDGMRLARLYSREHAAEVYRQVKLPTGVDDVWIGLNDRKREGAFTWVGNSSAANETPIEFELWWESEPNNVGRGENCVMFWYWRVFPNLNVLNNWNDAQCSAENVFLCGPAEESSDPCARFPCSSGGARPPLGCVAVAGNNSNSNSVNGRECLCDEGLSYVSDELGCVAPPVFDVVDFQLAGVTHALFVSPLTTWTEADRICRSRGMALVKISTAAYAQQLHQTVVAKLVERGVDDVAYWSGLNDRAREGKFVWVSDGTPAAFTQWTPRQPDNYCSSVVTPVVSTDSTCRVPGEDCGIVWQSGAWNDEPCWSTAHFVCSRLI